MSSMRSSKFGGGEYFGKLRPEVPKYSMRSSNFFAGGGLFLVSSELKSLSPPSEVPIGGGGYSGPKFLSPP